MLRELRTEDAEAVAGLIARTNPERRIDALEVLSWLGNTQLDPDDLRVLEEDGEVVGYVDLTRRKEVAFLDPTGAGREDGLLAWAEARARDVGATLARLPLWAGQRELAAVAAARGYARIRSSFEMLIELDDDRPAVREWPPGVDVRTYRHPEHEEATYEAQEEAFRDTWDYAPQSLDQWREFVLNGRGFDPTLWFLGWDGDEIAGICLAFPERVGDPGLGWIAILGVRRPWRKRGLGEALLRHAFRELHARGLRRVGLGVDAESPTGATRLYERVGMRVASRSDSWEKQL